MQGVCNTARNYLDLHLTPVLVKLLLQLARFSVVARQLASGDEQPEANEQNYAPQYNRVDQPR